MNYKEHSDCLKGLRKAQEAEHDMRENAREAHLFVNKRDGQWEPYWWEQNSKKPRYTFDLTTPIIDQITGDMERLDYNIGISPAGGEASEDAAEIFDGIIRNIENISGADAIFSRVGKEAAIGGIGGWRVTQEYADENSFDQDLKIEYIANYKDRVWHGPHENRDASDARCCWVLSGMDRDLFKKRFPEANDSSVSSERQSHAYYHRHDLILVGEFLYLEEETRELVLMSNGRTYEDNEDFQAVKDELAMVGVMEVERRQRKLHKVYSRLFSNDAWLTEPRETVFRTWIPVVPIYVNFDYMEEKVVYYGAVEKLMDPQRVLNYSLSREIEEGALAPRQKYWMTRAQAAGHEAKLATLNTNSDPVQFFNPDPELPGPPQQVGGAQINPGLRTISEAMQTIIGQSAGMFAANMGDNPGAQSGVAIEALQERGEQGNNKYVSAREIAQRHTGRILVNAIPRVYTPGRQVRLLHEDGSQTFRLLGETVPDMQTGRMVQLIDLTVGTYDVVCKSAPAFTNRQSETVRNLTEVGKIDPTVIELGGDILLGNIPSPGMDDLAKRKRRQLFTAGLIPPDQMTEEEQQEFQAMQQQPPQETPDMVLAKAEHEKAMADHLDAQNKASQIQQEGQVKSIELQIKQFEAETNRLEAQIKHAEAMANIKGKAASAAKALAEAEAQDIENDAAESGIMQLVDTINAGR